MAKKDFFQTWNRPEYKEWATPTDYGYELHIIRKEPDQFLVVKAKLIMGEKGLPGFEVIEEHRFSNSEQVTEQIQKWTDSEK